MPSHGRVQGVRVVRPLLRVTREQVLQYLRRYALTFRVDSSNEDRSLARNFVRKEILPRVASHLNPAAREAILRGASAIREAERYLAEEARVRLPEVLRRDGEGKISLDAIRMLDYPKPLGSYLFRYAVQELSGSARDLAASHINALLSLVKTPSSRSVDLPGGIRARRERGRVVLEHRIPEATRSKVPSKT